MRTQEEIEALRKEVRADDFMGILTYTLNACAKILDTHSAVAAEAEFRQQIYEIIPWAWRQANECKELEVIKGIQRMYVYLWMLEIDIAEQLMQISHYGKPQLKVVCEHFGIEWQGMHDGKISTDGREFTENDLSGF